ncbi:hypothetical protein NKH99_27795 [Mesorhizobium sp. M0854]|uniref:hypothetical protein n=1 Tax=Mesorhizobium sp. M0854 TaxID=2957013 RepID=UPI003339CBF7
MIDQFLRQRVAVAFPPRELERLSAYFHSLIASHQLPPRSSGRPDWSEIAQECGIAVEALERAGGILGHGIDAITRFVGPGATKRKKRPKRDIRRDQKAKPSPRRHRLASGESKSNPLAAPETNDRRAPKPTISAAYPTGAAPRRTRGMKPKPIVKFPEPLWTMWEESEAFKDALRLHMDRHGDTCWHLYRAIYRADENFDRRTLLTWLQGTKAPRSISSFQILSRIETRYRLPEGYFKAKLAHPARAATGHRPSDITPSQRRRLAWHLPDDFDRRSHQEREEILEWVQRVIISGGTDYRRFQALALRNRYAVRFRGVLAGPSFRGTASRSDNMVDVDDEAIGATDTAIDAPERLWNEMAQLLDFKTATLTAFGYQRVGVWGGETAAQKVEHFGLLFGALAAPPKSAIRGLGIPGTSLTFAMLVFPSVWDWYLRWRERRRGFYTTWEVDMLRIALALTRVETGWLRQHSELSEHLAPIPGLVSEDQIVTARVNWNEACDICHKHCTGRAKEIQRVAKVHRDPFETIMPILEADSPVGEYRKIADEIIQTMPDEQRYPSAAAEAVRSFLLIRFGLHTGLRQKNLRQMLICPKGKLPTSERQLADMKVGELRWSEKDHGWEVFIPSVAFKNANSSYFGDKPFRLILPNIGNLYRYIDAYVEHHRARLLRTAPDPRTFFVKTVKVTSISAAYDKNTFFEAWRLIIQRYGIYNPYTGRGVIKGLLPHGPHNIRDVLATHILKKTGSYEQASYAIQDTPEMVAQHYGRFLPQDKAALAARILNQVWEAA